jgi:hypothetical protein
MTDGETDAGHRRSLGPIRFDSTRHRPPPVDGIVGSCC